MEGRRASYDLKPTPFSWHLSYLDVPLEVSKRLEKVRISGLFHLLINGIYYRVITILGWNNPLILPHLWSDPLPGPGTSKSTTLSIHGSHHLQVTNMAEVQGECLTLSFLGDAYGCFNPKIGRFFYLPKWMVKIMENLIQMDDLGGKPPLFFGWHPYGCVETEKIPMDFPPMTDPWDESGISTY